MTVIRPVLSCLGALAVMTGGAQAQITIDRVQPDRLDEQPAGASSTQPPEVTSAAPRTTVMITNPASGVIAGVRLEGSSLPKEEAEAVMRPFIGSPITGDNLQALADAYSNAYARSSIALYSILVPEQTFAEGRVRIVAIENYVDEVVLAGDNSETASLTRAYAVALAADRPLTRPVLERFVLLMNDIPGATTTPRVIAGERADTVKLVLETKREPVETVVSVDTRGAARLGRTQVQGDVYLNGWGYEGNQTRLTTAASADFDRFLSAALTHAATFGPSGVTATASVGYFRTRPDDIPLEGQGYTAGLQVSFPVVRSAKSNVSLAGGIDGLDSENALVGQVFSSDRTRVLRAAVSAERQQGKTAWAAGGSISQGINGLGARVSDSAFATTGFTKTNLQFAVSRAISERWRILALASAQLTSDRLPTSEQMSLGGGRFGRAFESGSASGDSGLAGLVEVTWVAGKPRSSSGGEVYAFVDRGELWLTDRPGLASDNFVLSSAGLGVRKNIARETLIGLEGARALEGGRGDGWRMSLSLSSAF